jgi:hypothetical protein
MSYRPAMLSTNGENRPEMVVRSDVTQRLVSDHK